MSYKDCYNNQENKGIEGRLENLEEKRLLREINLRNTIYFIQEQYKIINKCKESKDIENEERANKNIRMAIDRFINTELKYRDKGDYKIDDIKRNNLEEK